MVKKKKKQDARGYQTTASQPPRVPTITPAASASSHNKSVDRSSASSQQTQGPRPQQVQVTFSKQQVLEDLLQNLLQLEENKTDSEIELGFSSTTGQCISERQLSLLYDRLIDIGITFDQIMLVVAALGGRSLSFTAALDWLCLHVPTTELPPILTEGLVRDGLLACSTDGDLDVIAWSGATGRQSQDAHDEHRQNNFLPVLESEKQELVPVEEHQKESEHKAWILSQYEYVDEGEESDAFDQQAIDIQHRAIEPNNQKSDECEIEQSYQQDDARFETDNSDSNSGNDNSLDKRGNVEVASVNQLRLTELQTELSQLQFDLKDEASNYMRSKADMKQLQSQVKQLQKQINKLKTMIAKEDIQSDQIQVNSRKNVCEPLSDEAADAVDLYDMFDEDSPVKTNCTQLNPVQRRDQIHIPDDSVSKSWTGALPADMLKDWCRKQKIKPPRFSQFGVTLAINPPVVFEETRLSGSKVNIQHYLAVKALCRLEPDRPLYGMLPPFYRNLWVQLQDEARQKQNELARDQSELRQSRLNTLLLVIKEKETAGKLQHFSLTGTRPEVDGDATEHALDSWKDVDDETSDVSPRCSMSNVMEENNCARKSFLKTAATLLYKNILSQRQELPMYVYRNEFLATVRRNPVTVTLAQTGAGKSTQCPQYLLEEALLDGRASNTMILCTQPRRIAATSVAERVAEEMTGQIGAQVGYQIRLESRRSKETKLLFCTTGVVLRRLVDDPLLKGISHVIVDEVHERQWQVDILLVTLRKLLTGPRQDLKVILMSATLDAQLFCSYFGGAPFVSVPGRTFPVSSYNLEHVLEETGHIIERDSRCAIREPWSRQQTVFGGGDKSFEGQMYQNDDVSSDFPDFSIRTRRSLDCVDESVINYDLIEDVLRLLLIQENQKPHSLRAPEGADVSRGSVLIFMPGLGEIRSLADRLQGSRSFMACSLDIVPLHSSLSSADQRKAFRPADEGRRKIIITTNIAETSVTIPDVVIVIDTGRVRELKTDKSTGTPKLLVGWCSLANIQQRSGRAGRVQPGLCIRLFSTKTEQLTLKERSEPELKRIPLEEVCLHVLSSGNDRNCREFLAMTPQPPSDDAILAALNRLRAIGAVSTDNGVNHEVLTPLGRMLSKMPLDPRLGKMLIYGSLFKCIEPITAIAACLSCAQPQFLSPFHGKEAAKAAQKKFHHVESDFITLYNVYRAFQETHKGGVYQFCKENFLNLSSLREAQDAQVLCLEMLCDMGFMERNMVGLDKRKRTLDRSILLGCAFNENGANEHVVHSTIFSGVYPNVAHLTPFAPTSRQNDILLQQKTENLSIYSSSVNSRVGAGQKTSRWICFHEKFGTANRVSVSTTCFVDPISIILFGSNLDVKHMDRRVIVDDWISLRAAAKTSVIFQVLRVNLQNILKDIMECVSVRGALSAELSSKVSMIVDGIVSLLR